MGRVLIEAVLGATDLQLCGAIDVAGSPHIGTDAAAFLGSHSGVQIVADPGVGLRNAQVLIDFTRPEGTIGHLRHCRELRIPIVIGTTGFDTAQKAAIKEASRDIPIVLSPNMSVGVQVTLKLLAVAAQNLGAEYDVEIIEAHHRNKVDAPSGTALRMGEVIAQARSQSLADCAVHGRAGHTGVRPASAIGFHAVRGGDIVGDHLVLFAGTGERIEIRHTSNSRVGYAQGSLQAARFLRGRSNGLYDMPEVLGLTSVA